MKSVLKTNTKKNFIFKILSNGYNKWRDNVLPSEILKELCINNDLKPPKITGNTIEVDGVNFEDDTDLAVGKKFKKKKVTIHNSLLLAKIFHYVFNFHPAFLS